ncbi:MAG: fibronectin type III domain-containing protein [Dehalococcoidia bacterium]
MVRVVLVAVVLLLAVRPLAAEPLAPSNGARSAEGGFPISTRCIGPATPWLSGPVAHLELEATSDDLHLHQLDTSGDVCRWLFQAYAQRPPATLTLKPNRLIVTGGYKVEALAFRTNNPQPIVNGGGGFTPPPGRVFGPGGASFSLQGLEFESPNWIDSTGLRSFTITGLRILATLSWSDDLGPHTTVVEYSFDHTSYLDVYPRSMAELQLGQSNQGTVRVWDLVYYRTVKQFIPRPIAGVEVILGTGGTLRTSPATARTDRDGRVAFEIVPAPGVLASAASATDLLTASAATASGTAARRSSISFGLATAGGTCLTGAPPPGTPWQFGQPIRPTANCPEGSVLSVNLADEAIHQFEWGPPGTSAGTVTLQPSGFEVDISDLSRENRGAVIWTMRQCADKGVDAALGLTGWGLLLKTAAGYIISIGLDTLFDFDPSRAQALRSPGLPASPVPRLVVDANADNVTITNPYASDGFKVTVAGSETRLLPGTAVTIQPDGTIGTPVPAPYRRDPQEIIITVDGLPFTATETAKRTFAGTVEYGAIPDLLAGTQTIAPETVHLWVNDTAVPLSGFWAMSYNLRGVTSLISGTNVLRASATTLWGTAIETTRLITLVNPTPDPPGALRAFPALTAIGLTWSPDPETSTVGYNVERRTGTEGSWQLLASVPTASYVDRGPLPGTGWYRVRAIDETGTQSVPSEEISATIASAVDPLVAGALVVTATARLDGVLLEPQTVPLTAFGLTLQRGAGPVGPWIDLLPVGGLLSPLPWLDRASGTPGALAGGVGPGPAWYRLTAVTVDGVPSAAITIGPFTRPSAPPAAPQGLSIQRTGNTALLRWGRASGTVVGYLVERWTSADWVRVTPSPIAAFELSDIAETSTVYRVIAVGTDGRLGAPSESAAVTAWPTGLNTISSRTLMPTAFVQSPV